VRGAGKKGNEGLGAAEKEGKKKKRRKKKDLLCCERRKAAIALPLEEKSGRYLLWAKGGGEGSVSHSFFEPKKKGKG